MKKIGLFICLVLAACNSTPSKLKDNTSTREKPRFVRILRDALPVYVGLFPQAKTGDTTPPPVAIELQQCSQEAAAAMLGLSPLQPPDLLAEDDLINENSLGKLDPLRCGRADPKPWPNLGTLWWVTEQNRYFAWIAAKTYVSVPLDCSDQLFATGIETKALDGIGEDNFESPPDLEKEYRLDCGSGSTEPVQKTRIWKLYRFESGLRLNAEADVAWENRFVAVHDNPGKSLRVMTILNVDGYTYGQIIDGRRKRRGAFIDPVNGPKFDALYTKVFKFFGYDEIPNTPDGAPTSYFSDDQRKLAPEIFVALCLESCAEPRALPRIQMPQEDGTSAPVLTFMPNAITRKINRLGDANYPVLPGWNFPACAFAPGSLMDHIGFTGTADTRTFTVRAKEAQKTEIPEVLTCPVEARCVVDLPNATGLNANILKRPSNCPAQARKLELQLDASVRITQQPLIIDANSSRDFDVIELRPKNGQGRIRVDLDCRIMDDQVACTSGRPLPAISIRDGKRLILRDIAIEPLAVMTAGTDAAPWGATALEARGNNTSLALQNVQVLPCATASLPCSFNKAIDAQAGTQIFTVDGNFVARKEALSLLGGAASIFASKAGTTQFRAPARNDDISNDGAIRAVTAHGSAELVARNVVLAAPNPLFITDASADGTLLDFANPLENPPETPDSTSALQIFDRGIVLLQSPSIKGFQWIASFDAFSDTTALRMDRKIDIRSPRPMLVRDSTRPVLSFVKGWYCVQPGPTCQ